MAEISNVTVHDGVLPGYASCGCFVGAWGATIPPPRCAAHSATFEPVQPLVPVVPYGFTTILLPAPGSRLSDDDVERIARRVAELLTEKAAA